MSTSSRGMAGRVDLSCVTAAHRALESVCAVGQQNVQEAHTSGLGHMKSSSGTPLGCLCCGAAGALPACQDWGCSQLSCCPGSFELQKHFRGNLVSIAVASIPKCQ